MPLTILQEDGPLGKAGTQVWINDPKASASAPEDKSAAPRKAAPRKSTK